jgi:hypothetical protein
MLFPFVGALSGAPILCPPQFDSYFCSNKKAVAFGDSFRVRAFIRSLNHSSKIPVPALVLAE